MGDFLKYLSFGQVLKVATYYFFFMLLFWGSTSKFGKKEFNDDHTSLEVMKSLRGFSAIGVILHHISQETVFQQQKVLTPFVNAGAYFVAIFFFCSGYGLLKSLDTKENYMKGFVKNRIIKAITIPFYVNVILYGLYYFAVGIKWPKGRWILNFTGLTMMNAYAWFPIVLTILYFAFYLCFKFIKVRPVAFVLIFLVIIGMAVGFCYNGHFAWWYGKKNWWLDWNHPNHLWWREQKILWFNGAWWINSAIAFLSGLLFAQYEKQIVGFFKKGYAIKFHILLILTYIAFRLSEYGQAKFGYWTEYSGKGPGIAEKIKTYCCQVPLFALIGFLVILFMLKYHVTNPVTRFFGKFSLDTYLMNLMALEVTRWMMEKNKFPFKIGSKYNLLAFAIECIVLTVLLGVAEKYLTDGVKKLLFPKKKKKEEAAA